jgi:(E)-4-hydroxy-3-methylbut-2-enyl-diphosphate synthase
VAGYDIIEPGTILADASLPHEQLVDIARTEPGKVMVLTSSHPNPVGELSAAIHALTASGIQIPVIARLTYNGLDPEKVVIRSSADFGALLLNGLIDGIDLVADTITEEARHRLALGILQATRRRISRTEFVSCPGCGRTLFDLQSTVKIVKEATSHLKGLKIAVMGCIVNGPGEMADADYGSRERQHLPWENTC